MDIALTGDVMLGRLVDRYVIRNPSFPPAYLWGDVLPLFHDADLRMANLECVISTKGLKWKPFQKAFHFKAHPRAIEVLQAAKFDCVTLANNHVLDYGPDALLDCLALLDLADIPHAGAGATIMDALAPVFLTVPDVTVGVIALTDNEPSWEATASRPGTVYVALDSEGFVSPYDIRIRNLILQTKQKAGLLFVSAHVGPNWGAPSIGFRQMAHQLVEWGADIVWGHSNHSPQGIELYRGKAILYSTGDFVDDYAVDPKERNDLSFLFVIQTDGRKIVTVMLHPVRIEELRVRRANGAERSFLQNTMTHKCAVFGTRVRFQDGTGTITLG